MSPLSVERFPRELLTRYQRRVPRYTSYPPATAFEPSSEALIKGAFERASQRADEPLSLYVHLPFCEKMCRFCGCHAIGAPKLGVWGPYLESLKRELALSAERLGERRGVRQLHWGGGSPNWLPNELTVELVSALREHFEVADDLEFSVEVAPHSLREGYLETVASLGVNRLSFGVQSFDERVQEAVGRPLPFERVEAAVKEARALGIESVNLDLMYGLPHQSVRTLERSLELVTSLSPTRVAVFGYAHLPSFKAHQKRLERYPLPSSEERVDQLFLAIKTLESAGYEALGLDHFVLPSDPLAHAKAAGTLTRNFQGYDLGGSSPDLLGVGLSAISYLSGAYLANETRLSSYTAHVNTGQSATARAYRLSSEELRFSEVVKALMCDQSASLQDFYSAQELYERLEQPLRDGLVTLNDERGKERGEERVHLTRLGRVLSRHVVASLDPALPPPHLSVRPPEEARFSLGM